MTKTEEATDEPTPPTIDELISLARIGAGQNRFQTVHEMKAFFESYGVTPSNKGTAEEKKAHAAIYGFFRGCSTLRAKKAMEALGPYIEEFAQGQKKSFDQVARECGYSSANNVRAWIKGNSMLSRKGLERLAKCLPGLDTLEAYKEALAASGRTLAARTVVPQTPPEQMPLPPIEDISIEEFLRSEGIGLEGIGLEGIGLDPGLDPTPPASKVAPPIVKPKRFPLTRLLSRLKISEHVPAGELIDALEELDTPPARILDIVKKLYSPEKAKS